MNHKLEAPPQDISLIDQFQIVPGISNGIDSSRVTGSDRPTNRRGGIDVGKFSTTLTSFRHFGNQAFDHASVPVRRKGVSLFLTAPSNDLFGRINRSEVKLSPKSHHEHLLLNIRHPPLI